jgi:hypothetical protein
MLKPASPRQGALEELITLGPKLLILSIENSLTMVRQTASLLPAIANLAPRATRCACGCCEIPETECPPRCACEVTWQASPGETPGLGVRVTNSSNVSRTFTLQATPFVGVGGTAGTIALAPTTLSLAPGQTGFVNATYTVPNIAEGQYDAEIVVRGAYERAVCVTLEVKCEKTRGEERCLCEVVLGDPPFRIRAHHWYDHFQCMEPCFDTRRPDVVPPHRD